MDIVDFIRSTRLAQSALGTALITYLHVPQKVTHVKRGSCTDSSFEPISIKQAQGLCRHPPLPGRVPNLKYLYLVGKVPR